MQNHVREFFDKAKPLAEKVHQKYGIPYGVVLAQAALETGWGRYVKGNSWFGIKGQDQFFATHEIINGKRVDIVDGFRAYESMEDSFLDYGHFLTTNGRYSACFLHADDPERFAQELQRAGYATDPEYANKLISIMRQYGLLAQKEDVKPMTGIMRVVSWIQILIVFAMPFTLLAEAEGKPGPEKRTKVVDMLKKEMDKLGLAPPDWLSRFLDPLLGAIVDVVVYILNRTGFFTHGDDL